jgi:signal transduction histidine kinase
VSEKAASDRIDPVLPAHSPGNGSPASYLSQAPTSEGRRERILQTLLASARHELRSPLQALLGFAELLDSGSYGTLSSAQRTFVEHMQTAGRELSSTIDLCTNVAMAVAIPGPAMDGRALLQSGLAAAVASPLPNASASAVVTREPEVGLYVLADDDTLADALTLALGGVSLQAKQRVAIEVHPEAEHIQVAFAADSSDGHVDGYFELDDLLADGKAARAYLPLKLAALKLAPFRARVMCTRNLRNAHVMFTRTH